ncbi:MAG TPA: hypothetical protein VIA18_17140 [Polyangia bacterium]|jgi:hypothetical protein|nr:hypothetical protein [Polyangia bacterium]
MRTKLGLLVGLMMAVAAAGCGGSATNAPAMYDCSAGLSVGTSDYITSGMYMALGDAPNALQLTRVSAGSSTDLAVYGTWTTGPQDDGSNDGLIAIGQFDFEPGMVTTSTACTVPGHNPTTATVTSTATISATQIVVLQNVNDDITF